MRSPAREKFGKRTVRKSDSGESHSYHSTTDSVARMASVTDFTQQQESVSVDTLGRRGLSTKCSLCVRAPSCTDCFIHKSIRAVKALDVKFALSQADNCTNHMTYAICCMRIHISLYIWICNDATSLNHCLTVGPMFGDVLYKMC